MNGMTQAGPSLVKEGEDLSMDEAFEAAGWTGQAEAEPVDLERSPGLNRNFVGMSSGDFKKPYTRGR